MVTGSVRYTRHPLPGQAIDRKWEKNVAIIPAFVLRALNTLIGMNDVTSEIINCRITYFQITSLNRVGPVSRLVELRPTLVLPRPTRKPPN